MSQQSPPPPRFTDDWGANKGDLLVWRRFYALWELRRKWNWANWFYEQLTPCDGAVVETESYTDFPNEDYMKTCLWIAMLRSVHEGITDNLDELATPRADKVPVASVLPLVPTDIEQFPAVKGSPFRDFRNAIFHCQWSPTLAKFDLDETVTRDIATLHQRIGEWLDHEFREVFPIFEARYGAPHASLFGLESSDGLDQLY